MSAKKFLGLGVEFDFVCGRRLLDSVNMSYAINYDCYCVISFLSNLIKTNIKVNTIHDNASRSTIF